MEKIFEQALLYDFYGELLTPHQQSIYEDAVYNDMSLGEIAQERGISRQGVHDLIKRCDKILQDYESKLHLVERFVKAKSKIAEIEALTRISEIEEKQAQSGKDSTQNVGKQSYSMEARADGEHALTDMAILERMREIRRLSGELMKEL